jgi:hypothetical protein
MKNVQTAVVIILVLAVVFLGAIVGQQHNKITKLQGEVSLQLYILQLLSEDIEKLKKPGPPGIDNNEWFNDLYSSAYAHKENTN